MIDQPSEIRDAIAGGRLVVPAEWSGFPGVAFGGFAAAAALLAAPGSKPSMLPRSLFGRFFRPVPVDRPVDIRTRLDHQSRRVEGHTTDLIDPDTERPLASFTLWLGETGEGLEHVETAPPEPLVDPVPVWRIREDLGEPPLGVMRHVGFRSSRTGTSKPEAEAGWHLDSEWPLGPGHDALDVAAVALMPVDSFVAPAVMSAQGMLAGHWPFALPTLDLAVWFHDLAASAAWLTCRTTVPLAGQGYAAGRTEVWDGERLVATGTSQVLFLRQF